MARATNRLTNLTVKSLSEAGRYADGDGLYLVVENAAVKRWMCFIRWGGKRREMGLGSAASITLAAARKSAKDARDLARKGIDPIAEKKKAPYIEQPAPLFGEVADNLIKSLAGGWRSPKTPAYWTRSFKTHAKALRPKRIDQISTEDVLEVLKPIWLTKSVTAKELQLRIERVLDAAKAKGLRSGENPARWRGHLAHLLPKQQRLTRGHFAAMPFDQVPKFMKRLAKVEGMSARALEWTILTAARENMSLGARWGEIDETDPENALWTVPASRMKSGAIHRAPLSSAARAVLDKVRPPEIDPEALIFPSPKGRPLSNMAMDMTLRRMAPPYVPHGFRSSFRDWAGDRTEFAREVAEAALSHAVGDQTERAYRRGDALEKRRKLMEDWGQFAAPPSKR